MQKIGYNFESHPGFSVFSTAIDSKGNYTCRLSINTRTVHIYQIFSDLFKFKSRTLFWDTLYICCFIKGSILKLHGTKAFRGEQTLTEVMNSMILGGSHFYYKSDQIS